MFSKLDGSNYKLKIFILMGGAKFRHIFIGTVIEEAKKICLILFYFPLLKIQRVRSCFPKVLDVFLFKI